MELDTSSNNTIPFEKFPIANTYQYNANVLHTRSQILLDTIVNDTSLSQQQQRKSTPILRDFTRPCQIRSPMTINYLRQCILPVFPELNDSNELYPLLTNISNEQLSDEEHLLRTSYIYKGHIINTPSLVSSEDYIECDIRNGINFYSQKWHIDKDILIVNLNRLFTILPQLTLQNFIKKEQEQSYALSIEEWFTVLEFYLQMDVECFFMKTCVFRNSKPRFKDEGIFCRTSPTAQFSIIQCRDKSCRLCYERLDLTHRFERAINFSKNQIHQFLNSYQVYLNADVVNCTTSNLIYALTCPCHQYDYIGRCKVPFRERMWQHRMNGCRIMSNFFIGQKNADSLQCDREKDATINESHTKLYQHSTQCTVALKIFLTCQPIYWCFVPMTREHAIIDNNSITSDERNILIKYDMYDSQQPPQQQVEEATCPYTRKDTIVRECVNNVPQPLHTSNYQFSLRQRAKQYDFFYHQLDVYPSRFLDLYNAAIVIVLPENGSDDMRHLIQALLIAHAEPKLNITIQNHNDDSNRYWYQHLTHPRLCASSQH